MEKPSAASTKHENKQAKKKQIKVVYISNPMRVKTTAAEFKGLVQELTGQDSDIAERLSKFGEMEQADVGTASADRGSVSSDNSLAGAACPPHSGNGEIHQQRQQQRVPFPDTGTPYDMLDENFPAQILDDLESFMPSSSYYDSSPAIDESKNLA
ncbi:hypothetical protein Taro_019435 [Colocasia esculenta]|uniref:VQ domain-containing protein n=1 Tax=Colocasia esculenta TaxID=4460 RepID=A0A843UZ83_COLES|nr:hypothetical protein [Colocasia esculenta]